MASFPDAIVIASKICPCKDCKKRTPTCHGECKEYNEWLKSKEKAVNAFNKRKHERRK